MDEQPTKNQFIEKVKQSFEATSFVKLTLSKPVGKTQLLKNIYVRPVSLKVGSRLSLTYRYPTKDEVKNYALKEGLEQIDYLLGNNFLNGDLYTLTESVHIQYSKKRKIRVQTRPAAHDDAPSLQHDQMKKRVIQPRGKTYLTALGITNQNGEVLKSGQRKFKQINKYIEIVGALLKNSDLPEHPKVLDMGSGKGYLTFALYDYLTSKLNMSPEIIGVELRPGLVENSNKISQDAGFKGLSFVASDINQMEVEHIDVLIALHACDIATDMAIAKGIHAGAKLIVVAPCCHKQIRKAMKSVPEWEPILKHGILQERQAEILTDSIRALLLEANGYKSRVFEFISTEHTPKNVMVVGIKGTKNEKALDQVAHLKAAYGIEEHYLETLL